MATVIVSEPATDAISEAGFVSWLLYGKYSIMEVDMLPTPTIEDIRALGVIGRGDDPEQAIDGLEDLRDAAHILRHSEDSFMIVSSTWETLGIFVLPLV